MDGEGRTQKGPEKMEGNPEVRNHEEPAQNAEENVNNGSSENNQQQHEERSRTIHNEIEEEKYHSSPRKEGVHRSGQKQPGLGGEYLQGVQGSSGEPTVPVQVAKAILDTIKKGDLEGVKHEVNKYLRESGISDASQVLPYLHDDKYHHNAIFYAALIKEQDPCIRMIEYLVQNGVDVSI
jgi:hypothetical protein